MIVRTRGLSALNRFFTKHFEGTQITDFWSPYDALSSGDKQKCWPHQPLDTILSALAEWAKMGILPSMPQKLENETSTG